MKKYILATVLFSAITALVLGGSVEIDATSSVGTSESDSATATVPSGSTADLYVEADTCGGCSSYSEASASISGPTSISAYSTYYYDDDSATGGAGTYDLEVEAYGAAYAYAGVSW